MKFLVLTISIALLSSCTQSPPVSAPGSNPSGSNNPETNNNNNDLELFEDDDTTTDNTTGDTTNTNQPVDEPTNVVETVPEQPSAMLSGSFQSECFHDTDYDIYIQDIHTYTGSQFTWTSKYYLAAGCTNLVEEESVIGTFSTSSTGEATTFNFDYTITDSTITFHSSEDITDVNSESYCGISNWATGQPKIVQGGECAAETDTYFGSVILDGNSLYYSESDQTTEAHRDSTVERVDPLTRK